MDKPKYNRPNPVISGQVTPDVRETLERLSETYEPTLSQLVSQAVILGLPKLLKSYPLPDLRKDEIRAV